MAAFVAGQDRPRAMQITNSAIGIESATHDSASQMPSSTSAKISPLAVSAANAAGTKRIWLTVCRVLLRRVGLIMMEPL
jgi:hypothetical protein